MFSEIIILMVITMVGYLVVMSRFSKHEKSQTKSSKSSSSSSSSSAKTPPSSNTSKLHISKDMTALGYIDGPDGHDETFVIPERDRQNIGIFGEIGSGKTSVLRLLIMQDIIRQTGFLLIDPHREFSREVLSMIPEHMQDKVVYISLASIYQFGKSICINPLQTHTEHEKYIRTAGCIDNLKQYFSDGWGHRLETILRNMINLVISTPDTCKFLDIISILFDENKRNHALQKCPLPTVRNFWANVFPKYAPESAGAIYNKFDKIINTPPIAAIFSSVESTISIKEIIEDGKIVIIDLGSAATVDIIEFMGTMLINMFNLENKIRFDLDDSVKTPFNIYIDEVHMFSASVIRELLNNVRKYNMKVTVATQSIKVLDDKLAKELNDLFRCMVMFRCDYETARLLARNLPLDEKELAHLGFHRFAAFSQGFDPVSGIGKTRHIEIPSRWKDMAKKSLDKYGKDISTESYIFANKNEFIPKLTPLEYFLLNILYLERRDITYDELISAGSAKFGVNARTVNAALTDSLFQHHQFVTRKIDYQEGKNQYNTNASFSITKLAIQSIYSRAYAGLGAGGELHTGVISAIADKHTEQFHYCIPDLADSTGPRADLLVYEFQPTSGKKTLGKKIPNKKTLCKINPIMWSDKVIAVEVETDPAKHGGQIVINYEKNASRGLDVWFVVFLQKHKNYIIDVLAKKNIGGDSYSIILVEPKNIDGKNNTIHPDSSISQHETKHNVALDNTLENIINSNLTASQVMRCIEFIKKKEKKILKSFVPIITKQSLDTLEVKTRTKKDTLVVNPKLIKVLPNSSDTDKPVTTDSIGKYTNSEVASLKAILEKDYEGYNAICRELKSRGLGVRRKKNGGVSIYTL